MIILWTLLFKVISIRCFVLWVMGAWLYTCKRSKQRQKDLYLFNKLKEKELNLGEKRVTLKIKSYLAKRILFTIKMRQRIVFMQLICVLANKHFLLSGINIVLNKHNMHTRQQLALTISWIEFCFYFFFSRYSYAAGW